MMSSGHAGPHLAVEEERSLGKRRNHLYQNLKPRSRCAIFRRTWKDTTRGILRLCRDRDMFVYISCPDERGGTIFINLSAVNLKVYKIYIDLKCSANISRS